MIPDRPGYAAGSGGELLVSVHADDGSALHHPAGPMMASLRLNDPRSATPSRYFPILNFSTPPALQAGELYHIVFTNVAATPAIDYLSLSALYQRVPGSPVQPTLNDTDSALLLRSAGGAWATRKGYTPILQLDYADGTSEGIGYMEAWVGASRPISGTNAVRQRFTVTGGPKNVHSVAIRVARLGGTAPLSVRLEHSDGTLIEEGDIPASEIPLANPAEYSWTHLVFRSLPVLLSGRTYHLVLQASASSTYQVFPIRKGPAYGFDNATYFSDGHAQFKQGATWVGWTQWGVTNRTDSDLQFYFELK
jgi:hypothetical protein